MLKKIKLPSWSTRKRWQKCKAILPAKATLPAKFDARRQPEFKIKRATRLIQPNCYNLFDWTIQTREVIWYHFTQYHFYSRLYHTDIYFVETSTHWYLHLISNNGCALTTAPSLHPSCTPHAPHDVKATSWRHLMTSRQPWRHEVHEGCMRGAGMAQWLEHSPPTNVARVRFPDPASNVGWVCWFSSLHREVFSGLTRFPLSSKTKIWLDCVNC